MKSSMNMKTNMNMKLKKYKKKRVTSYISLGIILIVLSLIVSLIIIHYFSKRANTILYPLAESKTRKVVAMLINDSCNNVIINNNLYVVNKDNNDEIKMITYNSYEVNKLINEVTANIEKMFKDIENGTLTYYGEINNSEGGVIAEIPFGVIFGSSLLSNIGPKIKLRLNLLGDITSNIETEVKPYGINNAYIEVRISLTVTARIILPFVSKQVVISNVIPISMNIVQGSIPEAYISSYK